MIDVRPPTLLRDARAEVLPRPLLRVALVISLHRLQLVGQEVVARQDDVGCGEVADRFVGRALVFSWPDIIRSVAVQRAFGSVRDRRTCAVYLSYPNSLLTLFIFRHMPGNGFLLISLVKVIHVFFAFILSCPPVAPQDVHL